MLGITQKINFYSKKVLELFRKNIFLTNLTYQNFEHVAFSLRRDITKNIPLTSGKYDFQKMLFRERF